MVRNNTMELYEDSANYSGNTSRENLGHLKRSLTLDLNQRQGVGPHNKKPKLNHLQIRESISLCSPALLTSPDLQKIATPDLEKLLMAQQMNSDSLINPIQTPTSQILFPKVVTEAQELYARGFVDALNELQHSDSSQEPGGAAVGVTYTTLEPPNSMHNSVDQGLQNQGMVVVVKDEPQTVPSMSSTPPLSPIDMENQERIKLERKRQRNRLAASKCRRRKLERISKLEDKVKSLKGENNELSTVVHRLKEHVCRLKEQVMDHVQSGCQIMALSNNFC